MPLCLKQRVRTLSLETAHTEGKDHPRGEWGRLPAGMHLLLNITEMKSLLFLLWSGLTHALVNETLCKIS